MLKFNPYMVTVMSNCALRSQIVLCWRQSWTVTAADGYDTHETAHSLPRSFVHGNLYLSCPYDTTLCMSSSANRNMCSKCILNSQSVEDRYNYFYRMYNVYKCRPIYA